MARTKVDLADEVQGTLPTSALVLSGAQTASVTTSQNTTSTTYANLATVGPAVTVTIGASGMALVCHAAGQSNTNNDGAFASWAASGANTIAASDQHAVEFQGGMAMGRSDLITGLTPGSTTFTQQFRVLTGGATGTFLNRSISVIPL